MKQLDMLISAKFRKSIFSKYSLFDVILTYHNFVVSQIKSRSRELIDQLSRENKSLYERINVLSQTPNSPKFMDLDHQNLKTYHTPVFNPSEGNLLITKHKDL